MHSEMLVTLQSLYDEFYVNFFLIEMLITLIWQMIQLASVEVNFYSFPWFKMISCSEPCKL